MPPRPSSRSSRKSPRWEDGSIRPRSRLLLRRRADDPVVAEGADLIGGLRLELLLHDPVGDLGHRRLHPLELLGRVLDRDLLPGQDVEIALSRGLEPPRLARAHLIERELDVLAQLVLGLRLPGLVVDQLVRAVGPLVDAVDAPAQQVVSELEGEAALEPDGLGVARAVVLPVALECLHRAAAELLLVVGLAEAGAAP